VGLNLDRKGSSSNWLHGTGFPACDECFSLFLKVQRPAFRAGLSGKNGGSVRDTLQLNRLSFRVVLEHRG
jgi:hypothetical protein